MLLKECQGVQLRSLAQHELRTGFSIVARQEQSMLADEFRAAIQEMALAGKLSEIAQRHD